MAGPVLAYGSQLPNTIIYYIPHDLPPSLPPMAGPVYLSWLRPCNYLPASGPIRKVGGGGGWGLPYDDTIIYMQLVPEGGISYERGGGGGGANPIQDPGLWTELCQPQRKPLIITELIYYL